jgi:hypothetical protein
MAFRVTVINTSFTPKERIAMNIKKVFAAPVHSLPADVALLLTRVVAGVAFMMHGWPKIQNPLGWMGPEGFAPGSLQALAAISEFGGGLAWVLGLLTPLASLGIACTMGATSNVPSDVSVRKRQLSWVLPSAIAAAVASRRS